MNIGGLTAISYAVLWLVIVVQTLVMFEMLRQIGLLRRRMPPEPGALLVGEGLPRGTPAPTIASQDVWSGASVDEQQLRGRMALLAFLSPGCASCHALAPELRQFARDNAQDVEVVVICPANGTDCLNFAKQYALDMPILPDEDQLICHAYQVQRTPSATLLDADGYVRIHGIPNNLSQLEGLMHEEGTPMANRQWVPDEGTRGTEVIASP